jgi:hypothetical protein
VSFLQLIGFTLGSAIIIVVLMKIRGHRRHGDGAEESGSVAWGAGDCDASGHCDY